MKQDDESVFNSRLSSECRRNFAHQDFAGQNGTIRPRDLQVSVPASDVVFDSLKTHNTVVGNFVDLVTSSPQHSSVDYAL